MCVFICLTFKWRDNDDKLIVIIILIITTVMTINLFASLIIKFIQVH